MALFKILRGNASNLPPPTRDGWAYFTTDTHEFFIDYTDSEGQLQRGSITSPRLIPRLSDEGVYYLEKTQTAITDIIQINCGTSEDSSINVLIYNTGDSNNNENVMVLQCT